MDSNSENAWKSLVKFLGNNFPKNPKTDWSSLSAPYVCGLLATNPSQFSAKLHNTGFRTLDIPFHYHHINQLEDIELTKIYKLLKVLYP